MDHLWHTIEKKHCRYQSIWASGSGVCVCAAMRPPAIAFQRQQRQQRTLTLDSLRPSRSAWRLNLISSMATESYAGSLDADSRSITLTASMQRQPTAMVVPMMTATVVALFIGGTDGR
jgi:hypothetical protein